MDQHSHHSIVSVPTYNPSRRPLFTNDIYHAQPEIKIGTPAVYCTNMGSDSLFTKCDGGFNRCWHHVSGDYIYHHTRSCTSPNSDSRTSLSIIFAFVIHSSPFDFFMENEIRLFTMNIGMDIREQTQVYTTAETAPSTTAPHGIAISSLQPIIHIAAIIDRYKQSIEAGRKALRWAFFQKVPGTNTCILPIIRSQWQLQELYPLFEQL